MQLGIVGLGRMGANMARRLMQAGIECVVYDHNAANIEALQEAGATGALDLADLVRKLQEPRHIWMMIPAAYVDGLIEDLIPLLAPGDTLIDGGNSYYKDDLARAARLVESGIHYVDVGTSGGVWGLERGYCLMIGGEDKVVEALDPVFAALAPGMGDIPRTTGRQGEPSQAEQGYLHCGPTGAGHFVKMVHNGIEYAIMAAYAEGMNLLRHANIGGAARDLDAETAPLRDPRDFQFDIDVPQVAEVWRRGSVIGSWLLDLTANALSKNPQLDNFSGRVSDSGEGRWTNIAAIEAGVPVHVLSAALFDRFSSRGEADFANKILSAMRYEFGGHHEKV
ncbi:phosphogluconate dehydrogenase (NAD(+)-dependent, decarboxylating) [Thiolapillus brandeum]|uniref:6-phosphogluconate dehydrogenase decarboxylating n=1 Tax=Thiolapillus brandeum TaxID=1076588 RepID=A0A7U6JG12_9GAMM|nr:decarboxylating 6-phosphogluconate dehydrogenase [Thiolapillus brandeum]BAO43329.1 6-phosphogluconate dehydrogenase decarboxylating [Thiolapillus brandeum]